MKYEKELEEAHLKINELRKKIHSIKFSANNKFMKASGKLKFMTAYRFFRKDKVPIVK